MFFSIFYVALCWKSKMLTLEYGEPYEVGIFILIFIDVILENFSHKCRTERS